MREPESDNPWDWLQPHDAQRLGEVIFDPAEQKRWCRAVMLGGLPYMWRRTAATMRELAYEKLALKTGDKVFLIGESVDSCGFIDDIRARISSDGKITVVDITEDARDRAASGERGKYGQLATWRWNYTRDVPDEDYDCVAVLQSVQHAEDWRETGAELLRIMKKGRNIVLAEITFSPRMVPLAQLDIHLEYWLKKIFAGMGRNPADFSYYSPQDLHNAFEGLVENANDFNWKGVELFWGTKA